MELRGTPGTVGFACCEPYLRAPGAIYPSANDLFGIDYEFLIFDLDGNC
jgi:hypothetical protein